MSGTGERPISGNEQETAAPSRARPGRYGLLLILLVGSYLLSSFVTGTWVTAVQVALFATAAVLALNSSEVPPKIARLVALTVVTGSAVMIGLTLGTRIDVGVSYLWVAVVLLGAIVTIVHRVLSFGTVTLESIFGAFSAYILLGLMYAALFAAIDHLSGSHFFANGQPATTKTFQYFSFTTLTTLGYGDFTAAGNGGRSVAILEALTGQIFLATLVARLVAAFRAPADRGNGRAANRAGGPGS